MQRILRIKRRIIYCLAVTLCVAAPLVTFYMSRSIELSIAAIIPLVVMLVLLCLFDATHADYLDGMLIELSNLISGLTDESSTELFSETEDNLLSKLQAQVLKLSEILKAQNRKTAKERDEIKSLISDIAHQMKTPVAAVKMYGELLTDNMSNTEEKTQFTVASKEYLDTLMSALDRLCFLTDSMIKMSRLETGIIHLKPERAQLNDVILSAVKQVFKKAEDKEIEIVFEAKENFIAELDPAWSCEALFNILDNAVKYTDKGGKIEIKVFSYELFIRIDVKDNGQGIREEEMGSIFERFYRGAGSNNIEGIGIGLYFTRKIVMEQGGYIRVSSDGKSGSTFSVFFKR